MTEQLFYTAFVMPVPLFRHRVMFSDGRIIEVIANADGSTMRQFACECVGIDTKKSKAELCIVGVANLGPA